jgi:hypothetical protein
MNNKHRLIASIVSKVLKEELMLDEAAVQMGQLESSNIALYIPGNDANKTYILYDTEATKKALQEEDEPKYEEEPTSAFIVGYALTSFFDLCGFWTMDMTAARKGYGPVLYEIVMSTVAPAFVTSDRKSVTTGARRVWQYFYNHRANEFDIKKIDPTQTDEACAHDNSGPTQSLSLMFSLKNRLNTNKLQSKHQQFVAGMKALGKDEQKVNSFLIDKGAIFYRENYKDV